MLSYIQEIEEDLGPQANGKTTGKVQDRQLMNQQHLHYNSLTLTNNNNLLRVEMKLYEKAQNKPNQDSPELLQQGGQFAPQVKLIST